MLGEKNQKPLFKVSKKTLLQVKSVRRKKEEFVFASAHEMIHPIKLVEERNPMPELLPKIERMGGSTNSQP